MLVRTNLQSGTAFSGRVDNVDSTADAIFGYTAGLGDALYGSISNPASNSSGVRGGTSGKGAGVKGDAPSGRGGQFSGGIAAARLMPSAATTHPSSGAAGDLFVDSTNRLWFCKGGSTWADLTA
jgi:hypothetical protein